MNRNQILLFIVGISVIILVLLVYCYSPYFPNNQIKSLEQKNVENLTEIKDYLNERYINEVHPNGRHIISSEIEEVKKEKDPISKLDKIFTWEMKDWHNPDPIFPVFKPVINESGFRCYPDNTCHYLIYNNDSTKLMAMPHYEGILYPQKNPNGTWYRDDPYWIAYNKIGSCREIANLFSFMANEGGIESRTVESKLDHRWVEVNISGEWMYDDPWCAIARHYYNPEDGNLTFRNKWFNKREYFTENCFYPPFIQRYPDASDGINQFIEPTFTYCYAFIKKWSPLTIV